ncbi:MAG: DUF2314 domain-containing protein [Planctomycetaceae bacterium]
MSDSPVTFHKGDDPNILAAARKARGSFRYFWQQIALDFNRIVPALSMACLKVPFSDDASDPEAQVEQMWVDEITFDGVNIEGVLINAPNWLTSVSQGDDVSFPVSQISDWLLVIGEEVYGGYSIQVLRQQMSPDERAGHDEAWGLNFPDPETVLVPERNAEFEQVIADLMSEQLDKDPMLVHTTYDHGRTLLHLESLYGRPLSAKALLERGANPTTRCDRGWTAHDYAKSLQWDDVLMVLDAE